MLNHEADGLQQQKITSVSSPASPEQESGQLKIGKTWPDMNEVGMFRNWHHQHESMDQTYLLSRFQAGGGSVVMWGMFSWHTLGHLIQIEQRLNLNIVHDHMHPFLAIIYLSYNAYFQHEKAPCHEAKFVSSWIHEHESKFSVLQWPPL